MVVVASESVVAVVALPAVAGCVQVVEAGAGDVGELVGDGLPQVVVPVGGRGAAGCVGEGVEGRDDGDGEQQHRHQGFDVARSALPSHGLTGR